MELNEYQSKTGATAVYPGLGTQRGLEYVLFGLLGEAGELANKYKKMLRNEISPFGQKEREILMDEAGDVAWYLARVLKELDYTLEETAQFNINKLAARANAGQLKDHK